MQQGSRGLPLPRSPGNVGERVPMRTHAAAGGRLLVRIFGFCVGTLAGPFFVIFAPSWGLFGLDAVLDAWFDLYPAGMPADDPHAIALRPREQLLNWLIVASAAVGGVLGCLAGIWLTTPAGGDAKLRRTLGGEAGTRV